RAVSGPREGCSWGLLLCRPTPGGMSDDTHRGIGSPHAVTRRRHRRRAGAPAPQTRGAAPYMRLDNVFLDPPYREPIDPWIERVAPILAPGAHVYVERPLPEGLPASGQGEWVKRSRAGGVEFGLLVVSATDA